jgi:hypothetical protein
MTTSGTNHTMASALERRYRRMLRWYPRSHRATSPGNPRLRSRRPC